MVNTSKIVSPQVEFKRELPSNYRDADSVFFADGRSYRTKEALQLNFDDITATEFAIYNGLKLIPESLANPIHKFRMQYRHLLAKKLFQKKVILPKSKAYLFVNDYWSNSHYHWHCDLLPRLWAIKDELRHYTLLLPSGGYIKKAAELTLNLAGLKPAELIFLEADKYYQAKELSMVTHITTNGTTHPEIMKGIRNNILNAVGKTSQPADKIYVSRSKARYRKVLNENEVLPLVKEHGYDIILFEDLSLLEQINLCSRAKSMIGIHGAGLTNVLFMPEQSKLLEFRRDGIHHNHCYWDLAFSSSIDYYYNFGTADSDQPIEGNGCNLTMNIKSLSEVLEKMETA